MGFFSYLKTPLFQQFVPFFDIPYLSTRVHIWICMQSLSVLRFMTSYYHIGNSVSKLILSTFLGVLFFLPEGVANKIILFFGKQFDISNWLYEMKHGT